MVSRGMGRFLIHHHPTSKEFVLFVRHGLLTGLHINSVPIHDILDVRLWLAELLRSDQGEFEFIRAGNRLDMSETFALPLDQLLLSSFSELVEEQTFSEHFPDPQAVFEMAGTPAVWMDRELESFVDKAGDLLRDGACGTFLATTIGQPLDHVLLCLYKLRSTGHIRPRRAYFKGRLPPLNQLSPETLARIDCPLPASILIPADGARPLAEFVDIPNALAPGDPPTLTDSLKAPSHEPEQLDAQGAGLINRLITGLRRTFGIFPGAGS